MQNRDLLKWQKTGQMDIRSTNMENWGRKNKLQGQTRKMGLARELGEGLKDTIYITLGDLKDKNKSVDIEQMSDNWDLDL